MSRVRVSWAAATPTHSMWAWAANEAHAANIISFFNEISFKIKFMLPHTHTRTHSRTSVQQQIHCIPSLRLSLPSSHGRCLCLEAFSIRSRERKTLIE